MDKNMSCYFTIKEGEHFISMTQFHVLEDINVFHLEEKYSTKSYGNFIRIMS